ncbi:hypothetical protein RBB50_002384 [Rhinocladiella similis]
MSDTQRMFPLTFRVRRKKGLSEEEFHRYWANEHRILCQNWLTKYGIVKYTQYHTPSNQEAVVHTGFPGLKNVPKIDHDGSADFIMPDISCCYHARQDPFYLTTVLPDDNKLFDWDSAVYNIGWEESYIKDNKVVELPDGNDFAVERTRSTQS